MMYIFFFFAHHAILMQQYLTKIPKDIKKIKRVIFTKYSLNLSSYLKEEMCYIAYIYNLAVLCLNGTLPCIDFAFVIRSTIALANFSLRHRAYAGTLPVENVPLELMVKT